jgi:ADP-ribosyl-[dinitrogen reductase] hydrolase
MEGSGDGAMAKVGADSLPAGALIIDAIRFPSGGKVGMTHCPGRNHIDTLGRRWNGDLAADLTSIEAWGARALVSLIEAQEFACLGVPDLAIQIRRSHLDWYHLPIRDMCAPDDDFARAWAKYGTPILQYLQDEEKIVVHCAGGLGRTGTVVARLLIDFGKSPVEAIETVRRARPGTIESTAQENHVLDYVSPVRQA